MARGQKIAIVGAGNLGSALALALHQAGFAIEAVIARPAARSVKNAKSLAKRVRARAATNLAGLHADVVWFCVPDSVIERTACSLADHPLADQWEWKGKIALHSSGAAASDELDCLRKKGASVASVHPFMTFVRGSRPSLAGVPFAIEGDSVAAREAQRIVREVGGQSHSIRKQDKAAYHAWGAFVSPLLTALLVTSEQVAAIAGVKRKAALQRMMPIVLQTLANYATFGAPGAFSGPIVRGDVETVKRHLRVLRSAPVAREVYLTLARAALLYLPAKNRKQLKEILKG
jgi:predicted short-subunit dehydrogenase-like oxidoreductase (DUF2520 family)